MRRLIKAGLTTLLAAILVAGNLGVAIGGAAAQDLAGSPAVAASATATAARLRPGEPVPPAELEAYVDGVVRQAMAANHIAGVTVAVVQNGQVALKKGYGFARLNPATPVDPDKTLFRIAAISKTFTWIAVMKEVEAHAMRLDAPVNLYLPEKLQVRDKHRVLGLFGGAIDQPVLVRDLMNNTAGFEDRIFGQFFEDNARQIRPLELYLKQERPRRTREPGLLSTESNYGAALAGEAVSYVARKPFESLIESEITGPLHLDHTTFREPYPPRDGLPTPMAPGMAGNVSEGYRWAGGIFRSRPFEFVTQAAPAGAGSSTAGDMARYMTMILSGGQLDGATVYGPDTAAGFRRTSFANAPGLEGWANGMREFTLPGGYHAQGHEGATLSFFSKMIVVPDLNLGVFIAANTETGAPFVERFPADLVGRFYAAPVNLPRTGSAEIAGRSSVYNGTYVTTRRAYGGLEKFVDLLIGWSRVRVTRDGLLIVTRPGTAPQAFAADGPQGHFRSVNGDASLLFTLKDGRADRWMMAGSTVFERAGLWSTVAALATLAVLTGLVCLGLLAGIVTRDRRDFRETTWQARASLLHVTIAILFLLALAAFSAWATGTGDVTRVVYHWPGLLLLFASSFCLVAALLSVVALVMLPWVWRGGRRLDSWSSAQKLRYTGATLLFVLFSIVLLHWGGLLPLIS